jgi:hypothetical protein
MVNIYMSGTLSADPQKIKLRSPRIASRVYGLNNPGQLVTAVPRMRFMFFTEFILSPGGLAMTNNASLNTYLGNRGLSFKVKQVDKPKITLTAQDLNHYNKKKIAYTKIEYGEASMRIYDTVDDSMLATWIDYFTYYFGDSRVKKDQQAYNQSPVDPRFIDDSGWGLRPLGNDTQFFSRINVYSFYARTYTAFSYVNPKITSVDWQQRDYTSEEPEELNLHFKYEAIEYEAFGQPYNPTRFGWLPNDALNEPATPPIPMSFPSPRIFSNQEIPSFSLQTRTTATVPDEGAIAAEAQNPVASAPGATPVQPETPPGNIPGGGTPIYEPEFPVVPQTAPAQRPVAPRSVNDPVRRALERSVAESIAQQRAQVQRLTDAAVSAGLVPAGTVVDRITGTIEAGNIVTSVTVDGRTVRPTLSEEETVRVTRARMITGMQ